MTEKNLLTPEVLKAVTLETGLTPRQVEAVLTLSLVEEASIPFIARYRKEKTDGLDEVGISSILDKFGELQEREKRREFILASLKKQEVLTKELEEKILKANTLQALEDLYAPYKQKKKSKAMVAREAGLLPLAEIALKGELRFDKWSALATTYLNPDKKILTVEEAIAGAMDIITELLAHNIAAKEKLRIDYWKEASFKAEKRKDAEKQKDWQKFRDYFEFEQKISELKNEKVTHRVLALRRGLAQKILKVDVSYPAEAAQKTLRTHFFKEHAPEWTEKNHPLESEVITPCVNKAYQTSLHPALDLEIKGELKSFSDEAAINVFGVNLRQLLLSPYLGPKTVLGVDPGIRTGAKIAVVTESGELVFDTVIFPFKGEAAESQSSQIIQALIEQFKVEYIAVGNGTHGKETLDWLKKSPLKKVNKKIQATLVNEAGASIYSTSEIAREEFPDKDPTVRGAVSIARRFQDPLAELVKIDPKSIGVGQYQHDVNQARLKKSLTQTVESCVNYVGVDLNTASAPLLSYISGIGPALAGNIVKFRHQKGNFKSRRDLLKVPRFSDKVFEQCAGFLRIHAGSHPLDQTSIHPENYTLLETWCEQKGKKIAELLSNTELIAELAQDNELKEKIGPYTLNDIVSSLKAPGKDPRTEFEGISLRSDLNDIKDLKIGEWYDGIVNNITQFGAFVDIGIKENGLLHISEMSDKFVTNALEEIKVGEKVKVKVIEVDLERGRISLSRKTETKPLARQRASNQGALQKREKLSGHRTSTQKQGELKNNAFAALKNFKIK